ncbi:hypothetical protein [Aureibacter tunicatorum]|uniref:Uncharacterized protein n=1 Tax=Aureibacter tunicatorum TaxID=866807 RepID=A0AAE3XIT7_9BACT|nr:hypothetical protein [Aureibacter tunicatorum]MDR6238521.1 hypothetical protein [Aureibacter tunicatorum]BDD05546.1 hypothetical protein AUTU_30290 [Aureibacter tunicatorum]
MTDNYNFETSEYGINSKGIHLLRSRYNYKSFLAKDIKRIRIAKGMELNNWIVILAIGVGILIFGIKYINEVYQALFDDSYGKIYIEEIAMSIVLILTGTYFTYKSLTSGNQIFIETYSGDKKKLSLQDIKKQNLESELREFIRTHFQNIQVEV